MVFVSCTTDLLHTLSAIPRNLNFMEHTSDIGWKEYVAHLAFAVSKHFVFTCI